jgi:hypothetical protein
MIEDEDEKPSPRKKKILGEKISGENFTQQKFSVVILIHFDS